MALADRLTELAQIKGDIKSAIIAKGQTAGDNMNTYAAAIGKIETGGSSKPAPVNANYLCGYGRAGMFSDFDYSKCTSSDFFFSSNTGVLTNEWLKENDITGIALPSYKQCFSYCNTLTSGVSVGLNLSKCTTIENPFGSLIPAYVDYAGSFGGEKCTTWSAAWGGANTQKVWIPKEITKINAGSYSYSPANLLKTDGSCVIYTDAPEALSGWTKYWNSSNGVTFVTTVFGATYQQFLDA